MTYTQGEVVMATFNARIHEEEDGSYWAEVRELPGCFASGTSLDELRDALIESIQLYLGGSSSSKPSKPEKPSRSGHVDRMRLLVPAA